MSRFSLRFTCSPRSRKQATRIVPLFASLEVVRGKGGTGNKVGSLCSTGGPGTNGGRARPLNGEATGTIVIRAVARFPVGRREAPVGTETKSGRRVAPPFLCLLQAFQFPASLLMNGWRDNSLYTQGDGGRSCCSSTRTASL
jgi:hypothetical protein